MDSIDALQGNVFALTSTWTRDNDVYTTWWYVFTALRLTTFDE